MVRCGSLVKEVKLSVVVLVQYLVQYLMVSSPSFIMPRNLVQWLA